MRCIVLLMCALCVHGLPQWSVKPLSYKLTLNLTEGIDYPSYRGMVSIAFNATTALSNKTFTLHSSGIEVQSSSLTFEISYGPVNVPHTIHLNSSEETLTVDTEQIIEPGRYTLMLEFTRVFDDDLKGFYKSSYTAEGSTRWVASTHFETSAARRAFPCFDEPRWRANLTIQFHLPSNLHAASNMPELNTTTFMNGTKLVQFAETPAMPTYLYAWYVGDSTFGELTTTTVNNVRYGLHGRKSLQEEAAFSSNYAPQVISKLENFTGVSYNITGLTKMDQIGIPDFNAGAMEDWGFVMYREFYLFVNDKNTTEKDKERTLLVIAHEFAHQWFGNAVTLDWWSYTWLNEAFARYIQYFIGIQIEPSWNLEDQFVLNVIQESMVSDLDGAHPLTDHNVTSLIQIEKMFDVITYDKGASLLRMFSSLVGEEVFKTWLNTYLTEVIQSGGVATPDNLWKALPNSPLVDKLKPWTEVSGHPVVKVARNTTSGGATFVISQVKEALNGSEHPTGLEVPIDVVTSEKNVNVNVIPMGGIVDNNQNMNTPTGQYYWLKSDESASLEMNTNNPSNPEWYYLINNNTTGYYRVLYDKDNWMALKEAIGRSEIPPLTRAQLVSDALNLVQNGYLTPEVGFDFTKFLTNEQDFLVWSAALKAFNGIRSFLHGWEQPKNAFETYVSGLMNSTVSTKFIQPNSNPSHYEAVLRSNLASYVCIYQTRMCDYLKALPFLETYDVELNGAVFCEAVQTLPTFWNSLFTMYKNTDSPTQKQRYLASLSCTTNSTNQERLLESLLDPSIFKKQDFNFVLSSVSTRKNGIDSIMKFVNSNSDKIVKHLSNNKEKLLSSLTTIAKRLYNPDMIKTLQDLLDQTPAFGLTPEEKREIIAGAHERTRNQKLVAERVCQGFNLTCTPPFVIPDNSGAHVAFSTILLVLPVIISTAKIW